MNSKLVNLTYLWGRKVPLNYYYILSTARAEVSRGGPVCRNQRCFFMFPCKLFHLQANSISRLLDTLFSFIPVVIYNISLFFDFFFYDGFLIIPETLTLTIILYAVKSLCIYIVSIFIYFCFKSTHINEVYCLSTLPQLQQNQNLFPTNTKSTL